MDDHAIRWELEKWVCNKHFPNDGQDVHLTPVATPRRVFIRTDAGLILCDLTSKPVDIMTASNDGRDKIRVIDVDVIPLKTVHVHTEYKLV